MNSSKLAQWSDRLLEAGWLLGVTITPVFFNVYSSRVFEPDKLTTLRSLATIMAVVWLVRFVEVKMHRESAMRFTWRTPLVAAALVMMVVYLVSSAFSLVPYTSIVGSYQRLQGTYTLFGYLVIFFALLTTLRTREQLSRLLTVLIINSLPVALYGIVQHNGLDPLPWAGDVQSRVASNMGNAIFVAAYLIMIVPLTAARLVESFRDIMTREETRISDILRASAYIFILAVQLLTIWYSRSRGPWLGLAVGGFLFPYLLLIGLLRQARSEEDRPVAWTEGLLRGLGMGVGSLVLAAAMGGLGYIAFRGKAGMMVGGGLGLLAFGALWLYFVVERKGWRWLWLGWITIGLVGAGLLLAINLPGPLQGYVREHYPAMKRMTDMFDWERGTGKVRTLIWEGALELIKPHDPILFPDGTPDRFNAIRPLVGYGPESMYVAYNRFYPPELGHYESRTASPDRSHNETLDSVVITGLLGLAAYLFLFGSVFYWGFRWLGLMEAKWHFRLYVGGITFFSLVFFALFAKLGRLYFFAVAIPLGFIAGIVLFLTVVAFRLMTRGATEEGVQMHPHALLIVGIVAAVMAHFVEINFGIAIAATRTTFWALTGLLVVLGMLWVAEEGRQEVPATAARPAATARSSRGKKGRRRARRAAEQQAARRAREAREDRRWWGAVLDLALFATFLMGTLSFDFITNPGREQQAGAIIWNSLTQLYNQHKTSYGALMIFLFTWVMLALVGLAEYDREGLFGRKNAERKALAVALFAAVSFFGWFFFTFWLASLHAALPGLAVRTAEDMVDLAVRLAGVLGRYYALLFLSLFAMGAVLLMEVRRPAGDWGAALSWGLFLVLFLAGFAIIHPWSYDLIRADIIFKQGSTFANARDLNQKLVGEQHYKKAIELAPREDYYYLFLGKDDLEIAQMWQDDQGYGQTRDERFQLTLEVLTKARELNPLNTDHSANLARFYRTWAAAVGDAQQRETLLAKAEEEYRVALMLSPHNVILWNELAILRAFDEHDLVGFREAISRSLELDPAFETTWMIIGDVRLNIEKDTAGAIEAYQRALEIKPKLCNVRYVLGSLLIQQNAWAEAATELSETVEYCPNAAELWDIYRMLGVAYYYQGDLQDARQAAQMAMSLVPPGDEAKRNMVEELLKAIEAGSQN